MSEVINEVPLRDFVSQHGQAETANLLGLTQGGLSRALSKETRKIVIRFSNDGVKAFEIRPFPYKREKGQQND